MLVCKLLMLSQIFHCLMLWFYYDIQKSLFTYIGRIIFYLLTVFNVKLKKYFVVLNILLFNQ